MCALKSMAIRALLNHAPVADERPRQSWHRQANMRWFNFNLGGTRQPSFPMAFCCCDVACGKRSAREPPQFPFDVRLLRGLGQFPKTVCAPPFEFAT